MKSVAIYPNTAGQTFSYHRAATAYNDTTVRSARKNVQRSIDNRRSSGNLVSRRLDRFARPQRCLLLRVPSTYAPRRFPIPESTGTLTFFADPIKPSAIPCNQQTSRPVHRTTGVAVLTTDMEFVYEVRIFRERVFGWHSRYWFHLPFLVCRWNGGLPPKCTSCAKRRWTTRSNVWCPAALTSCK